MQQFASRTIILRFSNEFIAASERDGDQKPNNQSVLSKIRIQYSASKRGRNLEGKGIYT
jgi:hypothetical protein